MDTKNIIIKHAREVFERFGYNKTSMGDIAHAAKKGRRTIYSYFTNKEEVFRAVIELEVNELAAKLKEIINLDISTDLKLRKYMHTRMNGVRELTMYYDALRQDLINNLSLIERLRKEYDELEVNMIKSILDEGVECDQFAMDDTKLVANAIVLATKGFELPIFMGQNNYDHELLIDPLINLFYHGIVKKPMDKDH
jgi:AcrR family transcriptional regulator